MNANYLFVDNPLNRYTLSARNKLKRNADGSVDLSLARFSDKDKESNWMPVPAARFIRMLDGTVDDSPGDAGAGDRLAELQADWNVFQPPARSPSLR